MAYITICYINGDPVVYEGLLSDEDKAKMEALFPESEISWEVRQVEDYPTQAQQMMVSASEVMTTAMTITMFVSMLNSISIMMRG